MRIAALRRLRRRLRMGAAGGHNDGGFALVAPRLRPGAREMGTPPAAVVMRAIDVPEGGGDTGL